MAKQAPDRPLTAEQRVAVNVKLLRIRRGYTQGDLAERAGLVENRVWAIEGGRRRIHVSDLATLAATLEVAPQLLMADDPEPDPTPVYEVTLDGGVTRTVAADSIDNDGTWAFFDLRGVRVFAAPVDRVLCVRTVTEEAPNA